MRGAPGLPKHQARSHRLCSRLPIILIALSALLLLVLPSMTSKLLDSVFTDNDTDSNPVVPLPPGRRTPRLSTPRGGSTTAAVVDFSVSWRGGSLLAPREIEIEREKEGERENRSAEWAALPSGHRLRHRLCAVPESGTGRLRLRPAESGETVAAFASAFLLRVRCDAAAVGREMAQYFAWEEARAMSADKGSVALLLDGQCHAQKKSGAQGSDMSPPGLDLHDLLHWIRVVSGDFLLPPWWRDGDHDALSHFFVVYLGNTTATPHSASGGGGVHCFENVLSAGLDTRRWFLTETLAHRLRLRWIRYLHHRHQLQSHRGDMDMWGHSPIPPLLQRMTAAAIGQSAAPSTARSFADERPLRVSVFFACGIRSDEELRMAQYLREKFGQASRVQLLSLCHGAVDTRAVGGGGGGHANRIAWDYADLLMEAAMTDVLVAAHSAALLAVVAMRPGSVVVEIAPRGCRAAALAEWAAALRVSYAGYEDGEPREGTVMCSGARLAGNCYCESNEACAGRDRVRVRALRLYHLVKNGLTRVWLRNSRFTNVMNFDRR